MEVVFLQSFFNWRWVKKILLFILAISFIFVSPTDLFSQTAPQSNVQRITEKNLRKEGIEVPTKSPREMLLEEKAFDTIKQPGIATQAVVLTLASLLPFIIMILTSFLKIVVVLSLLRSALGVQQAPPNMIINGIALMLSIYVMYPTTLKMYNAAESVIYNPNAPQDFFSKESAQYFMSIATASAQPLQEFLKRNTAVKHQALYYRMAYRLIPEAERENLKPDSMIILVPSYITSQLKDAFEIGVLIYIPFFVIDLVTSNILLAMGMMMLSPVTISMPLKLFLLVMLDGWTLLIQGLVDTFQ